MSIGEDIWEQVSADIQQATKQPFQVKTIKAVGGGCINTAYRVSDGQYQYFVKTNQASRIEMFRAEAEGLQTMAACDAIRVPAVIGCNRSGDQAYLILEYLPLGGRQNQALLGRQLAAMHRCTGDHYGWHRDNTIGATPQPNPATSDWAEFWTRHRLGFQLQLASENGYGGRLQQKGERCLAALPGWLRGHQPQASVLHGDLWSGNYSFDTGGNPVLFDPAVYHGDREADLAMTELFGGFSHDFYAAYREQWPLATGYSWRKTLYNLYHIINHLNLFGGSYENQAIGMMDRLLAECA